MAALFSHVHDAAKTPRENARMMLSTTSAAFAPAAARAHAAPCASARRGGVAGETSKPQTTISIRRRRSARASGRITRATSAGSGGDGEGEKTKEETTSNALASSSDRFPLVSKETDDDARKVGLCKLNPADLTLKRLVTQPLNLSSVKSLLRCNLCRYSKERLALLQSSYNRRRTPPPLPPGYRVVLQEPVGTGSTKYRIVVLAPPSQEGSSVGRKGDDTGGAQAQLSWIQQQQRQRQRQQRQQQEEEKDTEEELEAEQGEVVGWVVVWRKGKGGSTLFLSSVEVKKDYRRRGIASRLLHEAEAFGAKKGCSDVGLHKSNPVGIHSLKPPGFNP